MKNEMEDFSPIFIIGVGRSGTTLVQGILNAHPEICFPPETHFITNYFYKDKELFENFRTFKEKVLNDKNFKRMSIDINRILERAEENGFASKKLFYYNLLKEVKNKAKKNMVGDKDPKNIEYVDIIKSIFPKSFLIHIIRDPRDVILSRKNARWSMNRPLIFHILIYKIQLALGKVRGKITFGKNYIEIKYEDLITFPERECKKVCNFLNVKYYKNMLNYSKQSKMIVSQEEYQWKKNIFKPIMSDNFNKWKKYLTKYELLIIEYLCREEICENGYELSQENNKRYFYIYPFLKFIKIVFPFLENSYFRIRGI
jgi:hypothetical protein